MILGVHHPALSVPSLEQALDFYCGKLGFESVMNAEIPSGIPPLDEAFGLDDAGCKAIPSFVVHPFLGIFFKFVIILKNSSIKISIF